MANNGLGQSIVIDKAFDDHLELLRKHLKLWNDIKSNSSNDPKLSTYAEGCASRTTTMIESCLRFTETKQATNERGMQNGAGKSKLQKDQKKDPKPRKRSHGEEGVDTSAQETSRQPDVSSTNIEDDMFIIDTTPLTSEQLEEKLGETTRKAAKHNYKSVTLESRPKKRLKKDSEVEKEEENHRSSFEERVAARLKSNEEKRKIKEEKKRKRESEAHEIDLANDLEPIVPPSKRRKQYIKEQTLKARELDPTVKTDDVRLLLSKKAQRIVHNEKVEGLNEQINRIRASKLPAVRELDKKEYNRSGKQAPIKISRRQQKRKAREQAATDSAQKSTNAED